MHSKKPKIGLTLSETLEEPFYRWPARKPFDFIKQDYYKAIVQAGGIPILLPNVEPPETLNPLIESLDGLLITGGRDMSPSYYGQTLHPETSEPTAGRDKFELAVFEQMFESRKPIMGICRGMQLINVALGGTLFQDLTCIPRQTLTHADPEQTAKVFHEVTILPESRLYHIINSTKIETNSSHHQVIDELGRGLKATAFAPDGIIEAIEHVDFDFMISVQWHPEAIIDREHSQKLFSALIEQASKLM
jgi:putative glutamine amidotransferase